MQFRQMKSIRRHRSLNDLHLMRSPFIILIREGSLPRCQPKSIYMAKKGSIIEDQPFRSLLTTSDLWLSRC